MSQKDPTTGLTEKQEQFCQFYCDTYNGAEAARLAGYAESGARQEACRLLIRPEISRRIEQIADQRASEHKILHSAMKRRLIEMALGDGMARFITAGADGLPRIDLSKAGKEDLRLLTEATVDEYAIGRGDNAQDAIKAKLKHVDPLRAMDLLARMTGGVKDVSESSNNTTHRFDLSNLNGQELDQLEKLSEKIHGSGPSA